MTATEKDLERVIARMQTIQRSIRSSGQPASRFELQELKDLGHDYARLVGDLFDSSGDSSPA